MPRLKRLRRTGRESRGRAAAGRIRGDGGAGALGPVRRRPRRRAPLLEASGAALPGAGRGASAAAGLIGVALAAGCGGGGGLAHGDFVKRADAICTAYRSATKGVGRPRSYDAVVAYVRGTLPLYEDALRKLRALEPPSQDAKAVHAWLAADGDVARATRALGDAARRRDSSSIDIALARVDLASSRGRRAAAGLGMRVCGTLATGR